MHKSKKRIPPRSTLTHAVSGFMSMARLAAVSDSALILDRITYTLKGVSTPSLFQVSLGMLADWNPAAISLNGLSWLLSTPAS